MMQAPMMQAPMMQAPMMQAGAPPLILASQSTVRAALLAAAGLRFEARPARVDEAAVKQACQAEGADAADAALTLAVLKAQRVRDPDALVIGADQILSAATPGSTSRTARTARGRSSGRCAASRTAWSRPSSACAAGGRCGATSPNPASA